MLWLGVLAGVLSLSPVSAQTPAQPTPAVTSAKVWTFKLERKTFKDKAGKREQVEIPNKHFYVIRTDKVPNKDKKLTDVEQRKLAVDFFSKLFSAVGAPPTLADYQAELVKGGIVPDQANNFIDNWLLKYSCETVYCGAITAQDRDKIALFGAAYGQAKPFFFRGAGAATPDSEAAKQAEARALKWLPNFLPQPSAGNLYGVRTGYYDMRRKWVNCAVAYIETPADKGGLGYKVAKGLTNENEEIYFPNLQVGVYWVSNLIPLETGSVSNAVPNLWFGEKDVLPTKAIRLALGLTQFEIKDVKIKTPQNFTCPK